MTVTDQINLIVHRHVAGVTDAETAEMQIAVLMDNAKVPAEVLMLRLGKELNVAKAHLAAARRQLPH